MDFKSLSLFQHLATSLHFGQTAQAMYVSPSTLSRVIQRLEEECGASLFVRDNRKVRLTAAGQQLLEFSQLTLSNWQTLKAEFQQQADTLRGEVSLFCSVTASYSHLPAIIEPFRHQYPQIDLKLITGDPAQATANVLSENVDAAIAVYSHDFPEKLAFVQLDSIPLILIAPKSSQITQLRHLDWQEQAFIYPDAGPSRHIVARWLAKKQIEPQIYAKVAGNEAIVSMVALGCGVGIVPEVVLDHSAAKNEVQRIKLADIEPYALGICALRKRVKEPALAALFKHAQHLANT